MRVINEIRILERDGKELQGPEDQLLTVESHWNYTDRVRLKVDGFNIVVLADELERAIENSRRHKR